VLDPFDQAVLDGVVVNVVDMPIEIDLIANPVLPETALPDSCLALALP
jgi:hypothetical protein